MSDGQNRLRLSLKVKILVPLLAVFSAFVLLFAAFSFALGARYAELRERLADITEINQKLASVSKLSAQAEQHFFQFRVTGERKYLSEIVAITAERSTLIEQVAEASRELQNRLGSFSYSASSEMLESGRQLQTRFLKALESGSEVAIRRASEEWNATEALNGARLSDLGKYLSDDASEARRSLQGFLASLTSATIGLLLCGAGSLWLLTAYYQRTMIRPLMQLSRGFRAVAEGDLNCSVSVPTARDEIHQMCVDFNAMTTSLRESNADLRAFVSVAAHDLRSPLATIRGFCDLMHDELSAGNTKEAGEQIARVAGISDRALELMDQLLKFEQVGRTPLEFRRVKLRDVIREAAENLSSAISESHAILETGDLPIVRGDITQLRALFQNLLSNAIKFRREGVKPRVRIEAVKIRHAGRFWHEISVADNGRGFSEELTEEIFKPFTRLQSSDGTEGYGVGLSTCRKIVVRHGGELHASSRPGEGATFVIRLPATDLPKSRLADAGPPDIGTQS